jgi:hypothetical protein
MTADHHRKAPEATRIKGACPHTKKSTQYAAADVVELTVVSRRKSYSFSLPAPDFTDPHRAALGKELTGLVLTAIKESLPMVRAQIPPHATERYRTDPVPAGTEKADRLSPRESSYLERGRSKYLYYFLHAGPLA